VSNEEQVSRYLLSGIRYLVPCFFVLWAACRLAAMKDFVPPAERIATFDNDGTLWSEQPTYCRIRWHIGRLDKALEKITHRNLNEEQIRTLSIAQIGKTHSPQRRGANRESAERR